MSNRTLILVDGENLVLRYESMLEAGNIPRQSVIHRQNAFVWNKGICHVYMLDVLRVCYFTTFVGDDAAVEDLENYIAGVEYDYTTVGNIQGSGTINPHVFKKARRSTKTKSVDINICTDALRHAYNRDVYRIVICSEDGDYVPLIREIMRQGVLAHVCAFSEGCHPTLKYVADDFSQLDEIFFDI